jgi:hypothetical protein
MLEQNRWISRCLIEVLSQSLFHKKEFFPSFLIKPNYASLQQGVESLSLNLWSDLSKKRRDVLFDRFKLNYPDVVCAIVTKLRRSYSLLSYLYVI